MLFAHLNSLQAVEKPHIEQPIWGRCVLVTEFKLLCHT